MITPIFLIFTCLISVLFAGLLISACMLAGKIDQHQLSDYEELGPLDIH